MGIDGAAQAAMYRQRAAEVRKIAAGLKSEESQQRLMEVAKNYERLAGTLSDMSKQ